MFIRRRLRVPGSLVSGLCPCSVFVPIPHPHLSRRCCFAVLFAPVPLRLLDSSVSVCHAPLCLRPTSLRGDSRRRCHVPCVFTSGFWIPRGLSGQWARRIASTFISVLVLFGSLQVDVDIAQYYPTEVFGLRAAGSRG